MVKVGDRVKKGQLVGTVTMLHSRGGTIVAWACRVKWDGKPYQYDATISDLRVVAGKKGAAK